MNTEGISDAIISNKHSDTNDIQNKLLSSNETIIQQNNVRESVIIEPMVTTQDEERFVCAGRCGRSFRHNDRTRAEKARGIQNIYCRPCKVQLEPNNDWNCCAVLACFCCCWIVGIPAIIYANQAQDALARGNEEGYRRFHKKAGLWIVITVISGVITAMLWFVYSHKAQQP